MLRYSIVLFVVCIFKCVVYCLLYFLSAIVACLLARLHSIRKRKICNNLWQLCVCFSVYSCWSCQAHTFTYEHTHTIQILYVFLSKAFLFRSILLLLSFRKPYHSMPNNTVFGTPSLEEMMMLATTTPTTPTTSTTTATTTNSNNSIWLCVVCCVIEIGKP